MKFPNKKSSSTNQTSIVRETVSTRQAACLLCLCCQRVRQLLKEGRIQGAEKIGRFWKIPLFNGIPRISKGTRGPKGTWRKRVQKVLNFIHVNNPNLNRNRSNREENNPVFIVKRGTKLTYCHEVEITGSCKLVYRPEQALDTGATIWIEVEDASNIITSVFA
jgi:hypothetical protein